MSVHALAQTAPKSTGAMTTAAKVTGAKSTGATRKYAKSTAAAKSTAIAKPASYPAASKSSAAKSSTGAKSTAAPKPSTTTASASSNSSKRAKGKTSAKPPVASYHPPQQQPTPDRYKEIQQALQDRGYFGGPVDGTWGPSSIDALKRFQHDQNLVEDGKIGSLSIIALGLGPKRATIPASAVAKPASQPGAPSAVDSSTAVDPPSVVDPQTRQPSTPQQPSQPAGQPPAETEPQ